MSTPLENHADLDERQPATPPPTVSSANAQPEEAPPEHRNDESFSWEAIAAQEAAPYWVPPGMDLNDWPAALRTEVAAVINPCYRELVLFAKQGLAQSTGITIVHLLWLEILDQIELARTNPAEDRKSDPLQRTAIVSGRESREQSIERHLRLVRVKLQASEVLWRLQEFKDFCRSQAELEYNYPNLAAFPRRPINYGKNEIC